MTATGVIDLHTSRFSRLVARLRGDDGMGLVELLIALLVLNIGIFATLSAFTSAATTIRRASHISTAAAIADQKVEALHNLSYTNIVAANGTNQQITGADGRTYNLQVAVTTGKQTSDSSGSTQVALATITVRDLTSGGMVLVKSTTTFSKCTQSGLGSETNPCQS